VNPTQASELLERAAASVTPSETDPAALMAGLGRRSVRRRRAWAVGSAAAVVAAVVTLPLAIGPPGLSDSAGPGTKVSFGGVSIAVPEGWKTSKVEVFHPCTAEPRTVYLAVRWDLGDGTEPSSGPSTRTARACDSEDLAWMAVVQQGVAPFVSPNKLVVKDDRPVQVEQFDPYRYPNMWTYRAYNNVIKATTAFISGEDETDRQQLLKRVTWPAGSSAPPGGGLALPDRVTDALTDAPPSNGMVVASDAKTLNRIRTKLAALRDPVPHGAECTLQKPGSVGISLGEVTVVLGDATCPQAISTGGGRVRAPAGLGQELLDLIVASDRAASQKATKD
jgi:hypothetical protein